MCAGWNGDFAFTNDFFRSQLLAIEIFVGATIGAQGRAFQGNSGEQALVARVGKNFGVHDDIGSALGRAAFGPSGCRGIGSEFYFAVEQRLSALRIHYKQDEVSGLTADLKSDADAFQRVQSGRSPLALVVFATAANHDAAPIA